MRCRMTINEAIEHAEEIACGNDQCAKDHAQLADWLRELRRARIKIDLLKTLKDGFKTDAQRYKSENAKLRELLADTLIDPRDYCAKYGIDYDGWDSANDDIDRRLRELGIEVR